MSKTLVNIITEDTPIPAYLFVKEMYEEGDTLMLISAKDTEDDLEHLSEVIGVPSQLIDEIVLKNDIDEFRYELICRTLVKHINKDTLYCVNLAGGTRYLAIAVQQVFEDANSVFYYLNAEDNQIIRSKFDDSIYNNDDYGYRIRHKMNVEEYLDIHDMEHDVIREQLVPIKNFDMCKDMFHKFVNHELRQLDFNVLEQLRVNYRNVKKVKIQELISPTKNGKVAIPQILNFIEYIGFELDNNEYLSRNEIAWLTGGWFEEYIYYIVKEAICPDDIVLGMHIWQEGVKRNNELDVTFIKNNKLFVIECKTGIETERMFNEIVYKACALRESLLGISCTSFIFTLKEDKDVLARIAENMDITLVDKEILTEPVLLKNIWDRAKLIANDYGNQ